MSRQIAGAALGAAMLMAAGAGAATFTVNVGGPLDIGTVATAPSGDTVFRIDSASGSVSVVSGSGRRIASGAVRSLVSIKCKPARSGDTTCQTDNVNVQIGTVGALHGRARALTNFQVTMDTASLAGAVSGTSPASFQLAPLGDNATKTFYLGADFPVAGDDSGLASGAGDSSFYVYVVNNVGVQLASDTDKGKVTAYRPLAVAKTADLNFGRIQRPASGSSTITLSASNGQVSTTGGAVVFTSPTPTAAAFTVSGEGGQQISVAVPSTLTLTGPGSIAVTVTNTVGASPKLSGSLGSGGTYSFKIGGKFTITSTTPTGAYSGVLPVNIDYN